MPPPHPQDVWHWTQGQTCHQDPVEHPGATEHAPHAAARAGARPAMRLTSMPMPTLQGYFEGGIPGEEEEEDRAGGRAAGCRECLLRCVQRAPLPRCSWTWARRCSRSATTWASYAARMPCGARCCTSTPGSWKLGAPPARPVLQVPERAPPAAPSDTSRRSSPWRRCITTGFTPHLLLRYCSCSRFSRLPHVLRGGWSCVEDKYELFDEAGRRRTLWEPRPIEVYLHPSRSRSSCLIRLGTERRGGRRGRGRLRGWGGGRRGRRLHFLHVPGGGLEPMGWAVHAFPAPQQVVFANCQYLAGVPVCSAPELRAPTIYVQCGLRV